MFPPSGRVVGIVALKNYLAEGPGILITIDEGA